MSKEQALEYARSQREVFLNRVMELMLFRTISTDPRHHSDMGRAAHWLQEQLRMMGFQKIEILESSGEPFVYGEWLGAGRDAPTLLIYGHYDVQPADPVEAWNSPPFDPQIRDNRLYGRGASDDKGQLFAVLAALESYLKTSGRLPVNVKVLLEGEEEISSPNLKPFIRENAAMLACDAVYLADDVMLDPETPLITYGIRGGIYAEVIVRGPRHDLHSGVFGGSVDNPANVLARILAQMQDASTRRVLIPGFYDRVLEIDAAERAILNQGPMCDAEVLRLTGAPALAGETGYTTAERVSVRPTFDILGIESGYTGPGRKGIIPSSASARIGLRLVPDQDPNDIAERLDDLIRRLAPQTVDLDVRILAKSHPAVIDYSAPAIEKAAEACRAVYQNPPVYTRTGGTIPITWDLQISLDVPVVMVGFGLPDDNIHAPNESLYLPNFYRGIEMVIHYLDLLAGQPL